jgi:hypothetical protein
VGTGPTELWDCLKAPRAVWVGAIVLLLLTGCGSKISEANYYKVQYGMDEASVDELLGPAHSDATVAEADAASTRPTRRVVKIWSRGGLKLSVAFADGKVVSRSAVGIPHEGEAASAREMTRPLSSLSQS